MNSGVRTMKGCMMRTLVIRVTHQTQGTNSVPWVYEWQNASMCELYALIGSNLRGDRPSK